MIGTSRWNLPLLMQGQAQKEISHNEALQAIDCVLQLAVVTRGLGRPPVEAAAGTSFIVGPAPTGDWTGCIGMVATYDGHGWILTMPRNGCLAWVCDEAVLTVFHDNSWHTLGAVAMPG